jgi:pimeloyl-ACP methyl ester carboxylesterase
MAMGDAMWKSVATTLVLVGGFFVLASAPAPAAESLCKPSGRPAGTLGVVALSGKNTFGAGGKRAGGGNAIDYLAPLKSAIRAAGFKLSAPEMPWSRDHVYDRSYEEAMDEIGRAAATLEAEGATRIVVAGHSLGANAALGYGALKGGVAGLIVLAPGHNPDLEGFYKRVEGSVAKARGMVAAGKGGETAEFEDFNQGGVGMVRTTAARYLSYFDPAGHAVIPRNAAALPPGTPLLWVLPKEDPLSHLGRNYAFAKAPRNPLNRFVTVSGGHLQAPSEAAHVVVAWLKCL